MQSFSKCELPFSIHVPHPIPPHPKLSGCLSTYLQLMSFISSLVSFSFSHGSLLKTQPTYCVLIESVYLNVFYATTCELINLLLSTFCTIPCYHLILRILHAYMYGMCGVYAALLISPIKFQILCLPPQ